MITDIHMNQQIALESNITLQLIKNKNLFDTNVFY